MLSGHAACAWSAEPQPRSAAELREAAAYYDRAAALQPAPVAKAKLAGRAVACRCLAEQTWQERDAAVREVAVEIARMRKGL